MPPTSCLTRMQTCWLLGGRTPKRNPTGATVPCWMASNRSSIGSTTAALVRGMTAALHCLKFRKRPKSSIQKKRQNLALWYTTISSVRSCRADQQSHLHRLRIGQTTMRLSTWLENHAWQCTANNGKTAYQTRGNVCIIVALASVISRNTPFELV